MPPLNSAVAHAVFRQVHGSNLVYNTCWEDPRLDRQAMRLRDGDTVMVITSAGCNALDYALDEPSRVFAVDMNYRQNALLELKLAAIRRLAFDDFFSLFGAGGNPAFPRWYASALRSELSAQAQTFWDQNTRLLARPHVDASFYHHGTTGTFGRWMVRYFRLAGVYDDLVALFNARTIDEQAEIYYARVQSKLWRPWLRRLLRTDTTLSLLGVPRSQRDHIERSTGMSVSQFMESCAEEVLTRLPLQDNYFWRLYLFGRYDEHCCPRYLREVEFGRLQAGLAVRISTHTSDVTTFLRRQRIWISHFVLLDHMDWLVDAAPAALTSEWQSIVDRARPGATVLWRSGGMSTDFVDELRVNARGRERRLGDLLFYDHDLAHSCHQRDRVHTYGSFRIAKLEF